MFWRGHLREADRGALAGQRRAGARRPPGGPPKYERGLAEVVVGGGVVGGVAGDCMAAVFALAHVAFVFELAVERPPPAHPPPPPLETADTDALRVDTLRRFECFRYLPAGCWWPP